MTYEEFTDYLKRFLWRDGEDMDIDMFVAMGEARLNRDLKIQRMEETSAILTIEGQTSDLPADYRMMRQFTLSNNGEPFAFVPLFELARQRSALPSAVQPVFSVSKSKLLLAGPMSVEEPVEAIAIYSARVPDFKTAGSTWLLDERDYTDLYVHAVLRHTGMYLRDDARVALWQGEYNEILDSVLRDDALLRYPDGQLIMPMPEGAA